MVAYASGADIIAYDTNHNQQWLSTVPNGETIDDITSDGNYFYAATRKGMVYKYDTNGNLTDSVSPSADNIMSVATYDDYLYAVVTGGTVKKYQTNGLTHVNSATLGLQSADGGSIAISDTHLYVGGYDGTNGKIVQTDLSLNTINSVTPTSTGIRDLGYDSETGQVYSVSSDSNLRAYDSSLNPIWTVSTGSNPQYLAVLDNGNIATTDDTTVYSVSSTGSILNSKSHSETTSFYDIHDAYDTIFVGGVNYATHLNDDLTLQNEYSVTQSHIHITSLETSSTQAVTGTVSDPLGTPIEGANVSTGTDVNTTTNATGEYTLSLEDGTYNVTADSSEYGSLTKEVTVSGEPVSGVDFTLGSQVSGTITTQNGDPVSNATVVGYAAVTDQSIQKQRQGLENLANQIPNVWREEGAGTKLLGESGKWTTDGVTSYVATHPKDSVKAEAPWITDSANLRNPLIELPANEEFVVSVWDATAGGYGDTTCLPLAHEYNCQLPGEHKQEATIVVERIGPGGDVTLNNTITLDKQSGGGFGDPDSFSYNTLSLSPGFYYIHEKGAPRGVPRKVGDSTSIIDAYEQDVKGDLSKRANEVQDAITNNRVERVTTTTDANGNYQLDVPANTKVVTVQAYHAPALQRLYDLDPRNITQQDLRTRYNAALTTSLEERTQTQRELLNSSVYFPSITKTAQPPAKNVDIRMYELSAPPGANVSALQGELQRLEDLLYNGSFSDLPPALQQNLEDLSRERTEELFEELDEQRQRNDRLNDRYLELIEGRLGEGATGTIDVNQTSVEDLRARIQAQQRAMTELRNSIEAGESIVERGQNTVTYERPFSTALSPEDVVVIAHYADGTSKVVNESYWSIDNSVANVAGFGESAVRITDYPLGEGDSPAVDFEIRVANEDGVGSARETIQNPTFSGKVPELDSIRVSSLQPGPDDRVSVTANPSEESSYRAVTGAEVFAPDGTSLATSNVSGGDTVNFTTKGSGAHTVRLTLEDTDGNQFVETFRLGAGTTNQTRPASVRAKEGPLGAYAIVGDGLDGGKVDVGDNGVTVTAQIGQQQDVPSEVHVYTESLSSAPDETITVRVVRGDSRESINQHVRVISHQKALSEDALVYWGDAKPITTDGATRFGELTLRSDGTTISTYTDASGELQLRTINAPGFTDRARHWVRKQLANIDVPFVGTIVVPTPNLPTDLPTPALPVDVATSATTAMLTAPTSGLTAEV